MSRQLKFLLLLLAISCAKERIQLADQTYTLTITASNIADSTKLYLKRQEGYLSIKLDSTVLKDGKAMFSGAISTPEVYGIFIEGYREGIFPIVEKGTISIKVTSNDMSQAKISGSKLNDQLAAYKQNLQEISSKMNDLFHEFQKARAENDSDRLSELNEQMRHINEEKNQYSVHFIGKNNDSFVASMVLHSLLLNGDLPRDSIIHLYNNLSKEVKSNHFSKDILFQLQLDSITQD